MKRLVALAGLAAFVATGCRGRPRSWDVPTETERPRSSGAAVLEFDLSAGAPETAKGGVLAIPSRHTFDALVASLHQASKRKDLKGVFVAFGAAPLGWARAHEVADALEAIRNQKVPVLCHADAWDNGTYAAAARGCDTIAMSPGGEVELTGPAATITYARELLVDKLKAQVDILQVGKFKGAAEPLTRDGPSEEFRTSLDGALGAIRASYQAALAARQAGALMGQGPFVGPEAKDKKLVDLLVDRKAARDEIKKKAGDAPVQVAFGAGESGPPKLGLLDFVRLLSQPTGEATARPHVRLVRLHGEISLGGEGSGGLLGGSSGIVARRVVERAHALAEDARVKAVVLRIDSPGGSALGSDLAWIALKELRDKKPVIVSIGEMAASGGYYLACTGTRVFAEPESIVGSIGVVGGKIAFGGTLAQVGVHTASFGDPRAAQMTSLTEPWDDATRARLLETMRGIYKLFLERVGAGRGRAPESFDPAVEGRVFGGARAKELGLIDELGGLSAALDAAKKAANLDETAPIVVDDASSFFEMLTGDDDDALFPLGEKATPELLALRRWLGTFTRATLEAGPRHVATMLPVPLSVR
ncbi:MAG: S49 family peptidase [Sandaracinaceae bacterium]|nr:S49 family peptidase [Sandaracinaceae bacterium]